jgi:hypothetical protein
VLVGIPDKDSWFLNEYVPTGTARGWRRTGCVAMLVGALACIALAIIAGSLLWDSTPQQPCGPGQDPSEDSCYFMEPGP